MPLNAKRTVVTMLQAGPDRTVYGVFRAEVINAFTDKWTWNVHTADHVGSVTILDGAPAPSYQAIADLFASADWPAHTYSR